MCISTYLILIPSKLIDLRRTGPRPHRAVGPIRGRGRAEPDLGRRVSLAGD